MLSPLKTCSTIVTLFGLCAGLLAVEPTNESLKVVKENITTRKAVLLDVREQDEWDAGHLEHAAHLPLSKIETGTAGQDLTKLAPKDSIVYLHCAAGARSLQAAQLLQKHRRDLRPLQPGYHELLKAGFPKAKN